MSNVIANEKHKNRTVEQIARELEKKRKELEKKKSEIKLKKEKFIEENKGMLRFCSKCNQNRPLDDYVLIFRNKKGTPEFQCKECKKRRTRRKELNEIIQRGY